MFTYEIKQKKFFRNLSLGTGALTIGLPTLAKVKNNKEYLNEDVDYGKQQFNMCGYAAPKINVVRIGIVGLGMRGSGAVERLSYIDDVGLVYTPTPWHLRIPVIGKAERMILLLY